MSNYKEQDQILNNFTQQIIDNFKNETKMIINQLEHRNKAIQEIKKYDLLDEELTAKLEEDLKNDINSLFILTTSTDFRRYRIQVIDNKDKLNKYYFNAINGLQEK